MFYGDLAITFTATLSVSSDGDYRGSTVCFAALDRFIVFFSYNIPLSFRHKLHMHSEWTAFFWCWSPHMFFLYIPAPRFISGTSLASILLYDDLLLSYPPDTLLLQ